MSKHTRKEALNTIARLVTEKTPNWWHEWEFEYSRYGVAVTGLRCKGKPTEWPVVCIYINYERSLSDMRILFLGSHSQKLNRSLGLRSEITSEVSAAIKEACSDLGWLKLLENQQ